MKPYLNIKNIITGFIIVLLSCDVSLLFAAQTNVDSDNSAAQQQQQQLQQIQQLQQNLQQQLAQNDTQVTTTTTTTTPPPAATTTQAAPVVAPTLTPAQVALQAQAAAQAQQGFQAQQAAAAAPALGQAGVQAPPRDPNSVSVQDVNSEAFNAMTQQLLPMTPDQIQRLRQLFNQSQYAAAALPVTPPRPVISSQFVNLAPGTTPAVVRLQQGMVSVLTFLDSTGAPWPIQAYDVGNPSAFNIQWNKTDNTMMIQPLSPYTYGNLAVILQGLSTPLMLTLTTGQRAFDARLDLHIQGLGPNAQSAPTGTGLPNTPNPDLLGVLDGVPPPGSTALQVSGGTAQAWLSNGQLYVRTRYTILSPGWIATMSSADGMKAYVMPKAPLLLASQNGKIIQIKLEGL